jgi:hypothetical protein
MEGGKIHMAELTQSQQFKEKSKAAFSSALRFKIASKLKENWSAVTAVLGDKLQGHTEAKEDNFYFAADLVINDVDANETLAKASTANAKLIRMARREAEFSEGFGEAVRENTGDTKFLGGAKWMDAIVGFFEGLMRYIANGFSGGFLATITACIKERSAGNIAAAVNTTMTGLGMDATTAKEISDETHKKVMAGKGFEAPSGRASLDRVVLNKVISNAATASVPVVAKPGETVQDIMRRCVDEVCKGLPLAGYETAVDKVKSILSHVGAAEAKKTGALDNPKKFSENVLEETIKIIRNDPNITDQIKNSLDKKEVKLLLIDPLKIKISSSENAIRGALGEKIDPVKLAEDRKKAERSLIDARAETQTKLRDQLTLEVYNTAHAGLTEAAKDGLKAYNDEDRSVLTSASMGGAIHRGRIYNAGQQQAIAECIRDGVRDVLCNSQNAAWVGDVNQKEKLRSEIEKSIALKLKEKQGHIDKPGDEGGLANHDRSYDVRRGQFRLSDQARNEAAGVTNLDKIAREASTKIMEDDVYKKLKQFTGMYHAEQRSSMLDTPKPMVKLSPVPSALQDAGYASLGGLGHAMPQIAGGVPLRSA